MQRLSDALVAAEEARATAPLDHAEAGRLARRWRVTRHPVLRDVLMIHGGLPVTDLDYTAAAGKEVVVDRKCGEAVLRGAEIFVPGVLACSSQLEVGDEVGVSVAVEPRGSQNCGITRGTVLGVGSDGAGERSRGCGERHGLHIGRAVLCVPRAQLFKLQKGVAFRMVQRQFDMPLTEGVLEGEVVLQNLPSVVAAHVLNPPPGSTVLDMCAAPGGKTAALAALMNNQGRIVAIDRTHTKVENIRSLAAALGVTCVQAVKADSSRLLPDVAPKPHKRTNHAPPVVASTAAATAAPATAPKLAAAGTPAAGADAPRVCTEEERERHERSNAKIKERQQRKKLAAANRGHDTAAFSGDGGNGPQFKKQKQPADESPPPTFHREQFAYILLDGPCSALGLRPRLTQPMDPKSLWSYQQMQRNLLHQAVALLQPGGTLVYSTCTINPGENEGNVRYALDTFPLKLVAAEPRIGGAGFGRTNDDGTVEHWLSEEERLLVQRFDPVPSESSDTIGFFIAKFQKDLAVQPGTVNEHSQERRR